MFLRKKRKEAPTPNIERAARPGLLRGARCGLPIVFTAHALGRQGAARKEPSEDSFSHIFFMPC